MLRLLDALLIFTQDCRLSSEELHWSRNGQDSKSILYHVYATFGNKSTSFKKQVFQVWEFFFSFFYSTGQLKSGGWYAANGFSWESNQWPLQQGLWPLYMMPTESARPTAPLLLGFFFLSIYLVEHSHRQPLKRGKWSHFTALHSSWNKFESADESNICSYMLPVTTSQHFTWSIMSFSKVIEREKRVLYLKFFPWKNFTWNVYFYLFFYFFWCFFMFFSLKCLISAQRSTLNTWFFIFISNCALNKGKQSLQIILVKKSFTS